MHGIILTLWQANPSEEAATTEALDRRVGRHASGERVEHEGDDHNEEDDLQNQHDLHGVL